MCFPITLFGLGVFGYVTAPFARFFVDRDAPEAPLAQANQEMAVVRQEVTAIRPASSALSQLLVDR